MNIEQFKAELKRLVDELKISEIFEQIENADFEYNKSQFTSLRNRFIDGDDNSDSRQSLRIFIGTLKENTKVSQTSSLHYQQKINVEFPQQSPILDPKSYATLKNITGSYYLMSLPSSKAKKGIIYQTPFKIYEDNSQFYAKMKGGQYDYKGKLHLVVPVIAMTLVSNYSYKILHLTLYIGANANRPLPILYGTFSGANSNGFPICGKEVLLRTDEPYEKLERQELNLQEILKSENPTIQKIAKYFFDYGTSFIKVDIDKI